MEMENKKVRETKGGMFSLVVLIIGRLLSDRKSRNVNPFTHVKLSAYCDRPAPTTDKRLTNNQSPYHIQVIEDVSTFPKVN